MYENICVKYNAGAGSKDEVKSLDTEVPSLYVGETSRTIQERAKEHWADYRGGEKAKMRSHIFRAQTQKGGGKIHAPHNQLPQECLIKASSRGF